MGRLQCVYWDLDGTIADTEMTGHRIAFNKAFFDMSLNWSWGTEIYSKLLLIAGGKNRIRYYSKLIGEDIDDDLIKKIHIRKQTHYQNLVNNGSICFRTGVERLVEELQSRNIDQWIVTTSGKQAVTTLLSKKFKSYSLLFRGIISGEDVKLHKPNAEAYLLAIKKSKVNTCNSIVIEDSEIGLSAASSAKLKCVLTLSPWNQIFSPFMKKACLVSDHLGDINSPSKFYYGHTDENMVNYKCLLSLLENNSK